MCWQWTWERELSKVPSSSEILSMLRASSWQLVATYSRFINYGLSTQFPRFSDLTRKLIFDFLFRVCQMIVSWLRIKLTTEAFSCPREALALTAMHLAVPSPLGLAENGPFGQCLPQQRFHWGCRASVGFLQLTWRNKGGCTLRAFLLQGPLVLLPAAFLVSTRKGWAFLSFPSIFSFTFLLNVWSKGKE